MSWCTLYAASLKPRGPTVETCLIVIAYNCYSRLEYTFRVPIVLSGQHLPQGLRQDLYSFIQMAIKWAVSLMDENSRLASIDIGDVYYFELLSMVFHVHLDKRVEKFLTEIADKYEWTIQKLSTAQTFNREIQHVNQRITPADLCPLCLSQLGCLQYSTINDLLSQKLSGSQRNTALDDKTICEKEVERIGQAIARGDTASFRPIFQDPPGMSFCAKTLTELTIALTEQHICSWDPYNSALCSLLDMLHEDRQGAIYFLHKAKRMLPNNLFKNIIISMFSDLHSLIRHLPSPELKYTSAKYLEEDINNYMYKLLQSQSLRSTVYEFAGSFARLLPYYFEHEHIHATQRCFKGYAKSYQDYHDSFSDNCTTNAPLDLETFLSNINSENLVAAPKASRDSIANRFINQSVPDIVIKSPYFNLCYGTRFLVMLNCLTMLLHAKLLMTQMLMTSYESMRILRSCVDKDPTAVESVVKAKIPLPAHKREFLIRSLRSTYFMQNIINDICFLQDYILASTEGERRKAIELIKKQLEGSTESSTSDLDYDLHEDKNSHEENLLNSKDTDNSIGISLHMLKDIGSQSNTKDNSCIEDDDLPDESLFRASKSPLNNSSLTDSDHVFTDSLSEQSKAVVDEANTSSSDAYVLTAQGYQVKRKNTRKMILSILNHSEKDEVARKTTQERPINVTTVAYARTTAAPIVCPVIQKRAIDMILRIKNKDFT